MADGGWRRSHNCHPPSAFRHPFLHSPYHWEIVILTLTGALAGSPGVTSEKSENVVLASVIHPRRRSRSTCPSTVPDVSTVLRPTEGRVASTSDFIRRPFREIKASSPDFDSESNVKEATSVAVPFGSTELASGTCRTLFQVAPGAMDRDGKVAGMVAVTGDAMARPRPDGT